MAWEILADKIVSKLKTDTGTGSLVALTGHDETKQNGFRIARDTPTVVGRTPFLGVKITTSRPLMDSDATSIQLARVVFAAYATDELTSMKIADRVNALLAPRDDGNRDYYDFSDGDLSNRSTRFKLRSAATFDMKLNVWTSTVEADVIWDKSNCPASTP